MTDEYREILGKYITGNITKSENKYDRPSLRETKTTNKTIQSDIEEKLGYSINDLEYKILTNESTTNMVLYGKITDTNNVDKYFFAVSDSEYNILFVTTTFSSGTAFSQFVNFEYDDEGRIWGIDIYGTTTETGTGDTPRYRLLLLNNPAIPNQNGEFEVKIRKTYRFPIGYNKIEFDTIIQKIPDKPIYYVLSNDFGYAGDVGRVIKVKINVGSSNEWYQTALSTGGVTEAHDMLLVPSGDDYIMYYLGVKNFITQFVEWSEGSSPTLITDFNYEFNDNLAASKIISSNEVALISYTDTVPEIKYYYYKDGNLNSIASNQGVWERISKVYFINGIIFYCTAYREINEFKTEVITFSIVNNTGSISIGSVGNIIPINEDIILRNNYGLYIIDTIFTDSSRDIIYDRRYTYYSGLYSGLHYEEWDSLIPQSAELYNSTDDLIFARQLYNSTLNNNTTTSTVEVPNTLLNNTYISKQNLIGATSITLVSNLREITKNIYEKLFINFINTINVIDEDTNTLYREAATEINKNINSSLNTNETLMNNKKIAKMRINYNDGTIKTNNIGIEKYNNISYILTATIYIDSAISSIDILSYDESITYLTLDDFDLEVGEIYTLTQKVAIV